MRIKLARLLVIILVGSWAIGATNGYAQDECEMSCDEEWSVCLDLCSNFGGVQSFECNDWPGCSAECW